MAVRLECATSVRLQPRWKSLAVALGAVFLAWMLLSSEAETQTFSVLFNFNGGSSGTNPLDGLILDSAGNLYGTANGGGSHAFGVVFKVDSTGHETVLYNFTGGSDGGSPTAGLVRDSAGNLYGTTSDGGASCGNVHCGVVFKLTAAGAYSVLHTFTGGTDGAFPFSALTLDPQGNLYGTTFQGGIALCNCGTVFKIDTKGKHTVLYEFGNNGDGNFPKGRLIRDSAGNIFGATLQGGAHGAGSIYELSSTLKETVLHSFNGGTDGSFPEGGVIPNGAFFYGTTSEGTGVSTGTVFKINNQGKKTVVYAFTGGTDGGLPDAALVKDSAGNVYGTTIDGGAAGLGTVFEVDTTGKETVLHSFTDKSDGRTPATNLVRDSAGNLYGIATTDSGGGLIFKIVP